ADALPHEIVEIGRIPGREVELGKPEHVAEVGPDLGSQDAFQIDRSNHRGLSRGTGAGTSAADLPRARATAYKRAGRGLPTSPLTNRGWVVGIRNPTAGESAWEVALPTATSADPSAVIMQWPPSFPR